MNNLLQLLTQLWKQVEPPHPFSWQTFVLLSFFSWAMSLLVQNPLAEDFVATLGWLFFTVGMGWGTADTKIEIGDWKIMPGSWITGALVSALLVSWNLSNVTSGMILLPLFAWAIAAVPKFIKRGPTWKVPDSSQRQWLLIYLLIHGLISCWLGFYFRVQGWVAQYPSLLVDNLEQSAFVIALGLPDDRSLIQQSPGLGLLIQTEQGLRQRLEWVSWSEVEAWLLNREGEFQQLAAEAIASEFATPADRPVSASVPDLERSLWTVTVEQPRSTQDATRRGYILPLRATWLGPSSHPGGYFLEKLCTVMEPVSNAGQAEVEGEHRGRAIVIACDPVNGVQFPEADASAPNVPSEPSRDRPPEP